MSRISLLCEIRDIVGAGQKICIQLLPGTNWD